MQDPMQQAATALTKLAEEMIEVRMAGQSTAVAIFIGATLEMLRDKGVISTADALRISDRMDRSASELKAQGAKASAAETAHFSLMLRNALETGSIGRTKN